MTLTFANANIKMMYKNAKVAGLKIHTMLQALHVGSMKYYIK